MAGRFLVLSASMGAGHDAVASELIRRLRAAGDSALLIDVLDLLPPGVGPGLRGFYRNAVRHAPALYAGLYAAFFRTGGGPRPGSTPLAALAEKRLLGLVEGERPDAVVPVFHLAAQLTGRLRGRGALGVPSGVLVTDFAVHRQWLHPGNDLYLCLTRRTADEVHRMVGLPSVACGPLVPECFLGPAPGAGRWSRRLGDDVPTVLISAGAWGAGTHFSRTARLVAAAGYRAVVLCGRNEALRRSLSRTPGVLATGWVQDMPGLMAASRVLVDNAAGQTALEALAAGLPVVGYRPIPGHGVQGVRLMAEHGLARHARDPWALVRSLDALSAPGPRREARVAAGKALFTGHPGAVPTLEELAATAR
ncbi:MGDG synthase family glycosyltransferase [Streptomyces griseus]|uniref:MGDG synthase family glycosyltransferase n=1 Tax=Streptomyces griseus TaxID=1911 RepID=UPI0008403546|nr:glycosyltransferase [Streptomyces griseus]